MAGTPFPVLSRDGHPPRRSHVSHDRYRTLSRLLRNVAIITLRRDAHQRRSPDILEADLVSIGLPSGIAKEAERRTPKRSNGFLGATDQTSGTGQHPRQR